MNKKALEEELVAEAKRLNTRLMRFAQEPDPPQEIVPQGDGQLEGDLLDAASREAAVYQEEVLQRFLRMKGVALEEAWRRLQAGSYGICQGCGEPIPEKRLKAVPYAVFCLPCQEQREECGRGVQPSAIRGQREEERRWRGSKRWPWRR